jgi:sigma-B regulation protein RsbU (phosphoserine phosphatase)
VPEVEAGWAATLHHLWGAVAVIGSREQLSALVFPPLQSLPGVLAVWGVRHATDEGPVTYRWSGLPLEGGYRVLAESLAYGDAGGAGVVEVAGPEFGGLRERGVTAMIVARFAAGREADGTFLVAVGADADIAVVTACLLQVVEVSGEAVRRLAAGRADHEQRIRDALLAEASLQMDAVLDTAQTMYRVPRMAVPAIAEGCLVYAYDDGKPALRSAVHVDMRRMSALLQDPMVVEHLTALAVGAVAGSPSRAGFADAAALGTRTIDVQVLRARGRVIGVLIFLFDRGDDQIPAPGFLRDLASRAALAIDNSTLYERRRHEVVTLQQHLLPTRLPSVAALALAASYTVGDQVLEVGGDFYDVVVRDDGAVAALIGDVCGRGVDAAALTGMARHTLAALLQEGLSPARALGRLNARLRLDGSWRFVTAAVALLRPTSDGVAVEWTSAGHPAPIVLRRGEPALPGRGGGVPLGVLAVPRIGRSRLRLGPGDTLVMFTDGLTESRDSGGRMFEEGPLGEVLARLRDAPVEVLVNELSQASAAFGVAGADDIAVLAIRARERDGD